VQCSGLPESDGIVKIACSAGMVVAGYKQYSCDDNEIMPRQLASECVSIETETCREPFGEQQANMRFVSDSQHVYDRLPISANSDLAFHVECEEGYMFSAQAPATVVAKCVAMEKGKIRSILQLRELSKDVYLPARYVIRTISLRTFLTWTELPSSTLLTKSSLVMLLYCMLRYTAVLATVLLTKEEILYH